MATSTVEPARARTKPRKAKGESGFSVKAWLFGAAEADGEPEPEPAAPDEQSRLIAKVVHAELQGAVSAIVSALPKAPTHAASPTQLDGSHPAYLLRHIAMLALDKEIDPNITWQGAVDHLRSAWDMLLDRAAEQAAFERHTPVNAAEAAADGALLYATGQRGKPIGPGSPRGQVAVAEVVDRALNAPKQTALQTALTDDVLRRLDAGEPVQDVAPTQVMPVVETVPATTAGSPVHVPGEGLRPAIPADDEDADPGASSPLAASALPRRRRVLSFPAAMSANPGVPADGSEYEAAALAVMPGAWMLAGTVWSLVETASLDAHAQRVVAGLAVVGEVSLAHDAPVWLLSPEDAARLVKAYRAQLDALETEAAR